MVDVLGMDQDLFAVKLCTQILIVLSLIFYIIYCISQRTTESHAFLAIIGYHVFIIMAILWYHQLVDIYLNLLLFFVGIIFNIIATGMALLQHGCRNTIHAWFGFLSFAFACIIFVVGTILTFTVDDMTKDYLFIFTAVITLVMTTIALITGLTRAYSEWASCFQLVLHLFIIVLYSLLTVILVIYCMNYTAPTGGSSSSGGSGSSGGSNNSGGNNTSGNNTPDNNTG